MRRLFSATIGLSREDFTTTAKATRQGAETETEIEFGVATSKTAEFVKTDCCRFRDGRGYSWP